MNTSQYLVFECLYDIPTNLVATKVVNALHHAHAERKIVVVTPYPEIWLHNPDVYRVYKAGAMQYFYDDYIRDKDTLIFRNNPTLTTSYAHSAEPLENLWCALCGVPPTTHTPKLYFTWREIEATRKLTKRQSPVIFIESEAASFDFGRMYSPAPKQSWHDRIPPILLQGIIAKLRQKKFEVINLSDKSTHLDAPSLQLSLRLKLCAVQHGAAILSINSLSSHAAAYFNIPSVTLWLADSPAVWGYESQHNILPNNELARIFLQENKKEFSLLPPKNCPHNLNAVFDAEDICQKLVSRANTPHE